MHTYTRTHTHKPQSRSVWIIWLYSKYLTKYLCIELYHWDRCVCGERMETNTNCFVSIICFISVRPNVCFFWNVHLIDLISVITNLKKKKTVFAVLSYIQNYAINSLCLMRLLAIELKSWLIWKWFVKFRNVHVDLR